jgi:hypothetical protein
MTVRDVYIFEGVGQIAPDVDCGDSEAEVLDDVRYARRLRRAPLIAERSIGRTARERRSAALAEMEIEGEAADGAAEEAVLARAAFGGLGNLGAALAVIGLLIMAVASTGPSWGWGAGGFVPQAPGAYGFGPGPRGAYPGDLVYPDGPDARYAASTFETDPGLFVGPSGGLLAGGALFLVGLALLATRRRRFLFP